MGERDDRRAQRHLRARRGAPTRCSPASRRSPGHVQAIVAKVHDGDAAAAAAQAPTRGPAVEHAVLTALQKLPADRFGSAKDFADALDGKGSARATPPRLTPRAPSRALRARSRRSLSPPPLSSAHSPSPPSPAALGPARPRAASSRRFQLSRPQPGTRDRISGLSGSPSPTVAISPDGRRRSIAGSTVGRVTGDSTSRGLDRALCPAPARHRRRHHAGVLARRSLDCLRLPRWQRSARSGSMAPRSPRWPRCGAGGVRGASPGSPIARSCSATDEPRLPPALARAPSDGGEPRRIHPVRQRYGRSGCSSGPVPPTMAASSSTAAPGPATSTSRSASSPPRPARRRCSTGLRGARALGLVDGLSRLCAHRTAR